MEIGTMLGDAFEYTKTALLGQWLRWLILLVGTVIFPILLGYTLHVYRGGRAPPDPQDWILVCIDGIRLFVVQLVYAIPVVIISIALNLAFLIPVSVVSGPGGSIEGAAGSAALLVIAALAILELVLSIAISLVSLIASVRFARTGSFGEAFNIRAVLAHIGRIGWGSYILALIALYIALMVFVLVMMLVGVLTLGIGFLLLIPLSPALSIFVARYITLVYDSAASGDQPVPA
ncbi:MAG TPA: DUF4013 domain-containing protein [Methanoregulaceae archaeon]|nr:DUF4013 domain-containing protein [Methanoregulaceae archaeon]HOV67567.1 DUF4013 domain-containing protein [Methanoregulaceae archaeon]